MQKKLTPLEILQEQKKGLQAKSDELSGAIENHVKYMQQNFVPLLRDSVMESAISKLPSNLRNLAGNFFQKEHKTDTQNTQNSIVSNFILGISTGIAEFIPLFVRGKRGMLLSILLKHIIKLATR